MPGYYTDHHVHILATVAAQLSLDVTEARSIADLAAAVGAAPGTGWVRAWGYEEWLLCEGRHPTAGELDRAAKGRPVVLHHRSGHAAVLNTAARRELGLTDAEPGLLVDGHEILARVPRLDRADMERAGAAVSARWSAAGVGAVTDATHTNGPEELELLADWCARGILGQRVTAMVATSVPGVGPAYGETVGAVTVGAVKIMPAAASDGPARLAASVTAAHRDGFPVAVHVVQPDTLDETLDALERCPAPEGTQDRIEHNALCLPGQVERIAGSGAAVVVNPSFLLHRRAKYEAEVSAVERPWLVRIGSLLRYGVELRAGSDSPVTPVSPAEMLAAATAHPFAPSESVTRKEAERLLLPVK